MALKKFNTQTFIEYCNILFNNKFNLSKVEYITSRTPITVICPEHGEFKTTPLYFTKSKHGCKKCFINHHNNSISLTKEIFLQRASIAHNNIYNYEKFNYIGAFKKSVIICKTHGEFLTTPENHITKKYGCPTCRKEAKLKISKEKFINLCKSKHDNYYDYSKVNYISRHEKIIIICPNHGEFTQIANDHLRGSGCPKCSETLGEKSIRKFLEIYNIKFEYQKRFDDCVHKGTLIFDFYIESKNTCIEYDGIFHFKEMKFIQNSKEQLHLQKTRDNIKNEYCSKQNIKLIRIPYQEFNDINQILYSSLISSN